MAGRERERYKIEPRISVPFMLELEYESKIIKQLLVIKEICSWLQTFRPSYPEGHFESYYADKQTNKHTHTTDRSLYTTAIIIYTLMTAVDKHIDGDWRRQLSFCRTTKCSCQLCDRDVSGEEGFLWRRGQNDHRRIRRRLGTS